MVKALGQKETYSCKSIGIKLPYKVEWVLLRSMTFNGALSSGFCGWGSPFLLVPEASVDEDT
jgi:hypothetical protein